jgi:hypothetical protein
LAVVSDTANSVTLSWLDKSSNEVAFDLRWTSATAAPGLASFAANALSGTATGLAANTAYAFKVAARNAAGATAASNTVSGTTAPIAVTSAAATSALAGTTSTVNLSWVNNNPNIGTLTSVVVSGTVGGTAITPVTLAGSALSTSLTGLAQGAAYSLVVTVNGVGGSATTTVAGTTAGGVQLNAATGLAAQLLSLGTGTTAQQLAAAKWSLNWVDASVGETGYQVQVCYGNCTTATLTSTTTAQSRWFAVPAASVAYTGAAGTTGTASAVVTYPASGGSNYFFRVLPLNGAVAPVAVGPVSNLSAVVNLLNANVPAPVGVSAVSNSTGAALVSWVDAANNNSGYTVQARSTGSVGSVTVTGSSNYTAAPTVTFSAPTNGVRATGNVALVNGVVTVTITNPGAGYTTAPTVTFNNGTRKTGLPAATGTAVALGTNGFTTSAYAATVPANTTGTGNSLIATGLTSGASYQFRVTALGVPGGQGNSNPATSGVAVVK